MSPYYVRKDPGLRENLGAGLASAGLALGVGAVTFYLLRLFLAREPLEPLPPRAPAGELPPSAHEDPDSE
jgi:hypothetical protein